MRAQIKERTLLEARRVKAAKVTLLLAAVFLCVLSIWQCAESMVEQGSTPGVLDAIDLHGREQGVITWNAPASNTSVEAGESNVDPLNIQQEGISLVQASDEGSILWYQSMWSITQSRILLERALILNGWQAVSEEHEQVMSFVSSSNALVTGVLLYASFYESEQGCTILIELIEGS